MSSEIKPARTIVLCRISDDPEDERLGTARQRDDCLGLLGRLGWQPGPADTHLKVEDDTSAFKRAKVTLPDGRVELRTVRPKFRDALDMLASGRADGLVAYDLDRAVRDPRDLEDLIDVIEQSRPRIPVESVTGSLRLSNDGEVTMARVLVAAEHAGLDAGDGQGCAVAAEERRACGVPGQRPGRDGRRGGHPGDPGGG
jgi:site-specific DNA recombinase